MWFCMQAASSSGRDRSPIADHKTLTHCAAEVGQLPEGPPSLRASFALHWYSRDTDSFDIDMSTFTYLITGASRSLGLGYTRQLLKSGNHVRVVAGARNPSSADDLQACAKRSEKTASTSSSSTSKTRRRSRLPSRNSNRADSSRTARSTA